MKLVAAALGLALAVPAVAQMSPPPPETMPGPDRMHGRGPMFAGMSDAGRAVMESAMRNADPRADHAATDAARDRMLAVLDADRLDPVALKRAMDDEREAAGVSRARHQAAMIAGFQQLSLADRRAFVVNARAMRNRMQDRMGAWQGRRGPGPGMMPPPQ